jgi:hypothetical protein
MYEGEVVLKASRDRSTYCCGFTFQVMMEVAQERHLLDGRTFREIKRLQKQWYGSEAGSAARQAAFAMETPGIGHEVPLDEARAGDFVVFSRTKFGHSVILLDTIKRDGKIIRLHYRSSQRSTNGIGNETEYFSDSGIANGIILRPSVVAARLRAQ